MKLTKEEFYLRKKRLIIFVTLSVAYIGYGLFGQIFSFFQGKMSDEKIESLIADLSSKYGDLATEDPYQTFDKTYQILRIQNEYFLTSHLIGIIGFVAGMIGVLQMFKGKQIGFHLYIVYCIMATFGLFLYVPFSQIPMMMVASNVLLSVMFILFYYRFRIWDVEIEE